MLLFLVNSLFHFMVWVRLYAQWRPQVSANPYYFETNFIGMIFILSLAHIVVIYNFSMDHPSSID